MAEKKEKVEIAAVDKPTEKEELIETKIQAHIDLILRKEIITNEDYQLLTSEIARIQSKRAADKYDAEKKDRDAKMAALLSTLGGVSCVS